MLSASLAASLDLDSASLDPDSVESETFWVVDFSLSIIDMHMLAKFKCYRDELK